MTWEDARNRELAHWASIRGAIGTASPLELMTEINAVDALCEKAREGGEGPIDYCTRCRFYEQFGGCRQPSGRMSERIAAHDWESVRTQVDELMTHLRALEVPPSGQSA